MTWTLIIMITIMSQSGGSSTAVEVEYVPFKTEVTCRAAAVKVRAAQNLDPHQYVKNIYAQCFKL